MKTAFLFLSHGTRDAEGVAEIHQFCDRAARYIVEHALEYGLPAEGVWVERAFLELCDPDLPTALGACETAGAERVVLVPLLLFEAGHAKHDIPALIEQARLAGVKTPIEVLSPVGRDDVFIEVAADHVRQVATEAGSAMLFVGRGGTDPAARVDALAVADSIACRAGAALWAPAFLAGPGPDVSQGVQDLLMHTGVRQVVVLPYLWFTGRLLRALPEQVRSVLSADLPVAVASHLGCDERLVARVAKRALAFAVGR